MGFRDRHALVRLGHMTVRRSRAKPRGQGSAATSKDANAEPTFACVDLCSAATPQAPARLLGARAPGTIDVQPAQPPHTPESSARHPNSVAARNASDGQRGALLGLPAHALRAAWRAGYSFSDFRRDALAGIVVGIVALPLSMALSIAVGVPPQHGIYTAIVAGFVVALLGGSPNQITGPTAAFIVILAPLYANFGMAGLLLAGLAGGALLLVMGLLRFGRLMRFIPHPVVTGFTAGIGTVIAVMQLKDLLSLPPVPASAHPFTTLEGLTTLGPHSAVEGGLGLVTLLLLVLLPRVTKRVPPPLLALPVAAMLAAWAAVLWPELEPATIGSRFQTLVNGKVWHGIPPLPPLPVWPWEMGGPASGTLSPDFETLRALAVGAFAIALLGAIESLLSATVADVMAGTRHDPDAELLAHGVGNVLVPFFGGIPATGAIARTTINIRAGGRTPVAAMVHAVTVLLAVLVLAPLLAYLPMSALAALLLLVAWNMSQVGLFLRTIRVGTGSDIAVLLTCYGLTVAFDMVVGVTVGLVLAALLFMRQMSEVTQVRHFTPSLDAAKAQRGALGSAADQTSQQPRALREVATEALGLPSARPERYQGKVASSEVTATAERVITCDVNGPLFFGASQKLRVALRWVGGDTRVVIFRMHEVHVVDASGLIALEEVIGVLAHARVAVVLCDLDAQPASMLRRASLEAHDSVTICSDYPEALTVAAAVLIQLERAPEDNLDLIEP